MYTVENDLRAGRFLITLPELERFFKYIKKTDTCWNWDGYKDKSGYSRITIRNNQILGHVLSYVLHNGLIPSNDLHVLHSCDNPQCVNPDHLWLGTHQDNMKDRNTKGRCGKSGVFGERIKQSKLTNSIVTEIRKCVALGSKQKLMAERFGVSRGTINSIIKRKTWKQI